jgi:hypothetical protein
VCFTCTLLFPFVFNVSDYGFQIMWFLWHSLFRVEVANYPARINESYGHDKSTTATVHTTDIILDLPSSFLLFVSGLFGYISHVLKYNHNGLMCELFFPMGTRFTYVFLWCWKIFFTWSFENQNLKTKQKIMRTIIAISVLCLSLHKCLIAFWSDVILIYFLVH